MPADHGCLCCALSRAAAIKASAAQPIISIRVVVKYGSAVHDAKRFSPMKTAAHKKSGMIHSPSKAARTIPDVSGIEFVFPVPFQIAEFEIQPGVLDLHRH